MVGENREEWTDQDLMRFKIEFDERLTFTGSKDGICLDEEKS